MLELGSKTKTALVMISLITVAIGAECVRAQRTTTRRNTSPLFTEANLDTVPAISAAQLVANDSNWAGYIIASDVQNPQPMVTSVSASWIVPSVSPSNQTDTFSAIWIGIGGFFDRTLIQVGTEQDSIGGQGDYSAWYELLPQVAITIGSVSPGDHINASINLVNPFTDTWSVKIHDLTANETFESNFNYAASELSGEWIVERPLVPPTLTALADVGSVTLTSCSATIGPQSGSISAFPNIESIMYDSVQNTTGITQLTAVSELSSDGSSFTVETSPSAVPELSAWAILPLTMGTSLLGLTLKKRQLKKKGNNKSILLDC